MLNDVLGQLDLSPDDVIPFGRDKAKLPATVRGSHSGKLVLVTAISPTPAGEGKTTTSIGIADALNHLGERVIVALREPSLGPCFGIKGGGTGGGRAILVPTADINLHFTGDMHAVTAAHNLVSAMIDNALHFRMTNLDPRKVNWPRVLDVNDRSLRHCTIGLRGDGVPREAAFDITAASEVMAILCLASDEADLRVRLDRTVVGMSTERLPVTIADIGATGAMLALLRDALMPNIVQTSEGTPAFVHGGPFANIAHGCSSVISTRAALTHADWVITEAGFGADLGAEKFFDIKCRSSGLDPSAVVVVATVRALKYHGGTGIMDLTTPDIDAVVRGLDNLAAHLDTIAAFGKPAVVAINGRLEDTPEEVAVIDAFCAERGVRCAAATHFADGKTGAVAVAKAVMLAVEEDSGPFSPMYADDAEAADKIRAVAKTVYGADDVIFTQTATRSLRRFAKRGWSGLPICMAKTPASLSDNPKRRGRPTGFTVTVNDVLVNTGAGFLVALLGDVSRMPGLPRRPAAFDVDLVDGEIQGVE